MPIQVVCIEYIPVRIEYMLVFIQFIQPIHTTIHKGCLVQVGDGIELDTVGRQFEPYRWLPCGVTWDVVPEQSW